MYHLKSSLKVAANASTNNPHLSRAQNIVEILKEGLIFDLVVSEDKCDAITLSTSYSVQVLQVIH